MHTKPAPPSSHIVTRHILRIALALAIVVMLAGCGTQSLQQWQQERAERQALIALYESTDGPNWLDNTNWLSNSPICDWYGVTCMGDHVTSLHLDANNLGGPIPHEFGQLSNLRGLWLHDNQLTSLPPEIGQLSDLRGLWLHDNQLTSLPPEIGQLSNLRYLYLSHNQLTSLPPEIGQLSNLRYLYLSHNQLTSLPPEIGQLSNLREVYLYSTQLTTLPPEVCQLTAYIDLRDRLCP